MSSTVQLVAGRELPATAAIDGSRGCVALIGYQDQGNLGMGYLAAVMQEHGYSVEMIDIRDDPETIFATVNAIQPVVVGFSLIFQCFLRQFRKVARHLRDRGSSSHFTIGGHFASLCPEELLANFPEIDSVVRYEGEHTLVDLTGRLNDGKDWRETPGIAYLQDGALAESEPRALVPDLDSLPFPYRPYQPERIAGFPTLPVLASRGCVRTCSFCSIHTFYRTAPGKTVRVRKPIKVIEEMLDLHQRHGVRVFLFQDDDFPLWGKWGRRWVDELTGRMHDVGLVDRTIWKISCRTEYVESELFAQMRDAGLFLVYSGIESGTEEGLEILHKQMTIEQNLQAVATLKDLGIRVSYGFMLFDPSSTFESVRKNIGFLRQIVGDGNAAAVFSRMMPYGGTPIRDLLRREGRLRGDLTHPDYDFLDVRLNDYYWMLHEAVRPWVHGEGLSYQLNYAWDELDTVRRLVPGLEGIEPYRNELRELTAESNERMFRLVEDSSVAFEQGERTNIDAADIREFCEDSQAQMLTMRNRFVARNAERLMESINADCSSGPVLMPQVH